MDEFGVILVHNFFLNNRVIFALLRKLGEEEQQLRRQDDLKDQCVEHSNAGSGVQRGKRKEHGVYQDMYWPEQAKQA